MPDDDQYRKAVQSRVEEILSKRHEKGTSQLVFEAAIEGVKLYRSYKEEERKEGRERKGSAEKRGNRRHGMGENKQDSNRQHHGHTHHERTDRSKDEPRHQHRSRSRGRDHRRYRDSSCGKYRSSSQGKCDDRSVRVHHDRSKPGDGCSSYRPRGQDDNISGLASSVAGCQTSREDLVSQPRPYAGPDQGRTVSSSRREAPAPDQLRRKAPRIRSRERSRSLEYKSNPRLDNRRISMPRDTHERGEEALSRYQSRVHQRHADTRVEGVSASRSPIWSQKGPDGTPFGSLPKYRSNVGIVLDLGNHFVSTYKHIKAEQDAGFRAKGFIEKRVGEIRKRRPDRNASEDKQGGHRKGLEQYRRGREYKDHDNEEDKSGDRQPHASGSLPRQDIGDPLTDEPHSPAEPEITSKTSSTVTSHAPSSRPRPPVVVRDARAALLDSIQGGVRLRRVASLDKKDKSASSGAGRDLYEQTEHSREVEERERAQVAQVEDKTDTGPEPNRAFREDLLNALQRRNTGAGTATRDSVPGSEQAD